MGKFRKAQNRKSRRESCRYRCSVCKYKSCRQYNVRRHEHRIHTACSRPRRCCDLIFVTKGEFYVHCEESHPDWRVTNSTSRYKYRILPKKQVSRSRRRSDVTASPKKLPEIRYMLRSRVQSKSYCEDDITDTLSESPSRKSSKSLDKSETDAQMDHSTNLQESSGYGTKNSISATFDSTEENDKIKLLYSEELNAWETLNHHNILEGTIEELPEESNAPSPIKFSKNEQTTAGFGESSEIGLPKTFNELNVTTSEYRNDKENVNLDESSDLSNTSVYPEKSIDSTESNMVESEHIKTSSDDELKENDCMVSTSTPENLPPKKRTLLSLGFSNRENIARKAIDDRLYLPKSLKVKETPSRKKHRLSKKMKRQKIGLPKTFNELNVTTSEYRNDKENVNLDESSDLSNTSEYPEKSIDSTESNMVESEHMKTSSDDELKENDCMVSPSTPENLPPKKRILLSLGFSNHENIARKAIDDRLYLPKSLKVKVTPLRKKHRLSKKMKRQKLRERINLSKYSSASSEAENVPPTAANSRKQKIPGLKVDLQADGTLTWDEITRLMREHVRSIDFDSFKVTARRNGHRAHEKTR